MPRGFNPSTLGAAILVLVLFVQGCTSSLFQGQAAPDADNMRFNAGTYHFRGVRYDAVKGIDEWQQIAKVLNKHGCEGCENIKGTAEETIGSTVTNAYTVTIRWHPPRTSPQIDQLHADLLALKRKNVEIGLEWASVEAYYRGLTAAGKIRIFVRIKVTMGSKLFVDLHQTGKCDEVPVVDGEFNKEIMIKKGQEWIFYRTELDVGQDEPIRRYFRLNIISQEEEELSQQEFRKATREDGK
jgi:hypothetical protein